jgi:hypothetical protein
MKKEAIKLELFCEFHHVEKEFLISFIDSGLIEVEKEEESLFIPNASIENAERIVRLSSELGVNKAGIEIIHNMRQRLLYLNNELSALQKLRNELIRIGRFENEDDIIEFYLTNDDN